MFVVFLIGLIGSFLGFFVSSGFVSKGHVQRGTVALEDTGSDEYKVVFVTRYKVIPQVTIKAENDTDDAWNGYEWRAQYKKFRVDLVKATTSGFVAAVHRLPFKGTGKDEKGVEGYIYKLPLDARFRWKADGIPDPKYDSRSPWLRLTLPQRVFSIAGILFLIGLAADLLGILTAALQLAGQ